MTKIFNNGSGAWEATATWKGLVVPTQSDDVFLNAPRKAVVTVNDATDLAKSLKIDANTLRLNPTSDSKLTVTGDVIVAGGGTIEGGGELDAATFQLNGRLQPTGGINPLVIELNAPLDNGGNIFVRDGDLIIDSGLSNHGRVQVLRDTLTINGNVTDQTGTEVHHGGTKLQINGTLTESGTLLVSQKAQASVTGVSLINANARVVADHDSKITFSSNVSDSGELQASHHGQLVLNEGLTMTAGIHLVEFTNGTVTIGGAAIGGTAQMYDNTNLAFNGGNSTSNVLFEGNKADLVLAHASSYSGHLDNFHQTDQIDVKDVGYVKGNDFFDPISGILTLKDNSGHSAQLHFQNLPPTVGFSITDDGHGGTMIVGIAHGNEHIV